MMMMGLIALRELDVVEETFKSFLYGQTPDGRLPHIIINNSASHPSHLLSKCIYRNPNTSTLVQPPLEAETLKQYLEAGGRQEFVHETLRQLEDYFDWLYRVRVDKRDGLAVQIAPDETGMDNSPVNYVFYDGEVPRRLFQYYLQFLYWKLKWDDDAIKRSGKFQLKHIGYNSVYIRSLYKMSELEELGDSKRTNEFRSRAEQAEESLITKCFDDDMFYSLDARNDKDVVIKVPTSASLMPIGLPNIDERKMASILNLLSDRRHFKTDFPIPSEPVYVTENRKSSRGVFDILFPPIWGGCRTPQSWIFVNVLTGMWLIDAAKLFPRYREEIEPIARHITTSTCDVGYREDCPETWDSKTGKGGHARNFGTFAGAYALWDKYKKTFKPMND